LIFAIVNFVGLKLSKEINGAMIIPLLGFVFCLVALAVLIFQQSSSNITGILISIGIVFTCFVLEYWYKKTVPNEI